MDIVAKGGNFLLNVGPGPDGEIDPEALDRLREIGEWMKVNSEAIYGTRPIEPFKEGKVCLTQKKDAKTVYAIYLADEDERELPSKIWVSTLALPKQAKVQMLGTKETLKWEAVGKGFVVEIPEPLRKSPPCKHAWTLSFSWN